MCIALATRVKISHLQKLPSNSCEAVCFLINYGFYGCSVSLVTNLISLMMIFVLEIIVPDRNTKYKQS